MTDRARWEAAQRGERTFHCDEHPRLPALAVRRLQEEEQRAWYAGMLRIPLWPAGEPRDVSVTDFGCGPSSLLLATAWRVAGSVASDPLRFTTADEARYAAAGLVRMYDPVEAHAGPPTDEVWAYNVLQHVQDVELGLAAYARTARTAIRVFEWCRVPTDTLHLHVLTEERLRGPLLAAGWVERRVACGTARHVPYWTQDFYAAVWVRGTAP